MLCEKCNTNEATVHAVTIINGEKQEHHICSKCAKGVQFSMPSMMELLAGFGMMPQQSSRSAACETCGTSFAKFQKTALLGCPACYRAHRDSLLPVIKRAQGGRTRHVGRRPPEYDAVVKEAAKITEQPTAERTRAAECARLRGELKVAIREERYERAAELRDRLRLLEGGTQA